MTIKNTKEEVTKDVENLRKKSNRNKTWCKTIPGD
jgi:hypothetical protein